MHHAVAGLETLRGLEDLPLFKNERPIPGACSCMDGCDHMLTPGCRPNKQAVCKCHHTGQGAMRHVIHTSAACQWAPLLWRQAACEQLMHQAVGYERVNAYHLMIHEDAHWPLTFCPCPLSCRRADHRLPSHSRATTQLGSRTDTHTPDTCVALLCTSTAGHEQHAGH